MAVPAEIRQPAVADLTGPQKVAILLMAVGEEASAEITKSLAPEEVESISFEIAKLKRVEPEVIEEIIHEWQHTEHAAFSLAHGGVDYANRILTKAFGEQKASSVLKRIEAQLHVDISLTHLRNADPKQLVAVLRNEHPQAIALTLAFLDAAQTASVIREFDPEIGSEILMRMARMEKVQPDCLRVIEEMMGSQSDISLSGDGSAAGGPVTVAEVLNLVAAGLEKELLDGVAEQDVELAEEIKNLMFIFEDIVNLDDTGVTRLLRDVDTRELALALKLASEELKEKILSTMSTRARDSLNEEMECLGPQRVSDVEAAQSSIVKMARALEEAGEIVIGGGDDMVLV